MLDDNVKLSSGSYCSVCTSWESSGKITSVRSWWWRPASVPSREPWPTSSRCGSPIASRQRETPESGQDSTEDRPLPYRLMFIPLPHQSWGNHEKQPPSCFTRYPLPGISGPTKPGQNRLRNSFFPQAIMAGNTSRHLHCPPPPCPILTETDFIFIFKYCCFIFFVVYVVCHTRLLWQPQ